MSPCQHRHRPHPQGGGSAATGTALARAKAAQRTGGQLSEKHHPRRTGPRQWPRRKCLGRPAAPTHVPRPRPLSRCFRTASRCRTSRGPREESFPPGSGTCWRRAAGRDRGGICQNCKSRVCQRTDESTSRFQQTTHVKSPEHDAAHNGKERRRASGQRAGGEMAAPPPCWGAACSGGAREPWCPDHTVTPASALGSPRPRRGTGRRASQRPRAHRRTRTGQAGGHSPVCQETPHPEGAPRPAAGFALEGPPRATPRCGARMLRLHDRHAGQRRWPVRAQPPPASTFLT